MNVMKARFQVAGPPNKQKVRPLPEILRQELERQLESMLRAGVVKPSKSPWGSAPVFVKKKTGEWRLCLDYRAVNKRMTPDAYPIPLVWENVQMAAHHRLYTCMDCNWGFWNVPLEEESKAYTAIVTHKGSFEFQVVPFGIKNSPGEYQRAMDLIFGDLYCKGVLCYIDDITIYSDEECSAPRNGRRSVEEVCRIWTVPQAEEEPNNATRNQPAGASGVSGRRAAIARKGPGGTRCPATHQQSRTEVVFGLRELFTAIRSRLCRADSDPQ